MEREELYREVSTGPLVEQNHCAWLYVSKIKKKNI
jgi:hypothetical protein